MLFHLDANCVSMFSSLMKCFIADHTDPETCEKRLFAGKEPNKEPTSLVKEAQEELINRSSDGEQPWYFGRSGMPWCMEENQGDDNRRDFLGDHSTDK